MKRLKLCAAITAGMAALGWVFDRAETAAIYLLMQIGHYDYGRAAARATPLTGLIFGILGICILCGFYAWAQEREDRRLRKIRREHARTATPTYMQEED